jgi:predicted dehydrogenase
VDRTKVGVIGVGHLGRFHALNYAQIVDADLVGVFDADSERAGQVADESHCEVFESIDGLLDAVDAVSVAVPTDRHHQIVRTIFQKKVHCLVEKPIAATVEEADELVRMADEKGLILHVGQIERFNPAIRCLAGVDLHPRFIEAHRLAPFNPRGTEVAVILDLMIHDIDVVLSMVKSPVAHLDASGVTVVSESTDIANARIRFENGCVANLTASRISQKKMRKMRLFQRDTYISIDFDAKMSEIYQLESEKTDKVDMVLGEIGAEGRKRRIIYSKPQINEDNALRTELETFIHAAQGKPVSGVNGAEGRDALAVAEQILKLVED